MHLAISAHPTLASAADKLLEHTATPRKTLNKPLHF